MIETVHHETYGDISIFTGDTAIGRTIRDGTTLWEHHVTEFLHKYYRPGTNILDIGAFIGLHSIYAAKRIVSPGCKVYSIEAQPEVFKRLRDNTASLPNVVPLWFAATTYSGLVHVSCPWDYTVCPNPGGLGIVDPWFSHPALETRDVTCMRIDDVRIENVSVLKLDVEGHELITLTGCKELLRRDRPTLIVEILGGCNRIEKRSEIEAAIRSIELEYKYTCIDSCDSDYVFVPTTP